MNFTYRFNQLARIIENRRNTKVDHWILVYGLPRSGTSYLLNKLMLHARCGIGDWDLGKLQAPLNYFEKQDHIGFSKEDFLSDIRKNIFHNAIPGAGRTFDLIVKQIDISRSEFEFLVELMGCQPTHIIFCYREPSMWLKSARKKFDLDEAQAAILYKRCIESYKELGGHVVEYDSIADDAFLAQLHINTEDFRSAGNIMHEESEMYQIYHEFQAAQKQ